MHLTQANLVGTFTVYVYVSTDCKLLHARRGGAELRVVVVVFFVGK
jgi:hypothetical protein